MIWQKVIISFIITLAVSTIFSLFLLNFNFNFLYSFLFFILLQFVGFYFYGEYVSRRNSKLALEVELKALEEISRITLPVVCPCDRGIVTEMPVFLDRKNEYMCEGCNKKISVILEPKTALATDPLNSTLLDDPQFLASIANKLEKK